jgi:hypothetical protein
MVQSPSWAADWFADSQEIPRIMIYRAIKYENMTQLVIGDR